MSEIRVLVVGAGATGGYFGGRLAQAGRDVAFLVRAARAAQLRAGGLRIISEHGDVTMAPKLVSAQDIDGPYDLVLLTVKAYALEQAMLDLAPAVGSGTLILPTLNGLRHIELLTERFGEQRVLGGVCIVSTVLDATGAVVQLAGMQEMTYGPLAGGVDREPALAALDQLLQGAGFATRRTAHILPAMWQKWILLASIGAMNCLMRGNVGDIIAAPGGLAFARGLLEETAAVAAAAGYPLREAGREFIATMMTTAGSTFTSSMFRDLQSGGRVEVDAIVGDLVARADHLGLPTPLLRLALTNLAVYESRSGTVPTQVTAVR